ncbi:hypothetical protein [Priestia megaterium]|uniref:hypothetical protein n=1 Tax=Priestia megaterium TaxID=1404 RepID=UPI00112EE92B|nr:hypothetical protein [Priestia megaterium]TPF18037.1 hypothetical protein CBE78_02080 [Priestia megaterium]TPF22144.1 hypothetical protein CBE79_04585 [Priestia megaterium]
MKVISDYKELVGKTIAFTHMAQFADQITIATTDKEVLMATFEIGEYDDDFQIRVYREPHVIKKVNEDQYIREQLSELGIFDMEVYNKQQKELAERRKQAAKEFQEKREREMLAKLKEKYEND